MKSITILDPNYKDWIKELSLRYRKSQIKAAVKVNREMLSFYWSVGKDITEKEYDNKYGSAFYKNLSVDKCRRIVRAQFKVHEEFLYSLQFMYEDFATICGKV